MRRASLLVAAAAVSVWALAPARVLRAVEGAPYLLSNEGVQAAGLAGAFGAGAGPPEALWYNPGALTDLPGVEASFARMSFPGAYDSDHLLLAGPLGWRHHLGLMYHRNGTQDTLRDNFGNESGTFEVSQSVLGVGYSYRWKDVSIGASYKSLSEVLEKQSASASVFDVGTLVEFSKDALVLGAALQNIGSAPVLGSGGPSVEAPLQARVSANMRLNSDVSKWQLLGDYRYALVSARSAFALGVEYSEEYEDARLAIRTGWDFSQSALGGVAGLGLGFGIGFGPVGFDYAFAPKEALGNQHRVALTLLWDLRAKSKEQDLVGYLGPEAAIKATPSPTPTPTPMKMTPLRESNAGASLDALLAATAVPTPATSPTPVVEEKKQAPHGILGALSRLFSFGGAKEATEPGEAAPKTGLLQGVFHFLGFGSDAPTEAPVSPERGNEDAVSTDNGNDVAPTPVPTPTALPMQKLKGDSAAIEPTPVPTPMADKVKGWMKF